MLRFGTDGVRGDADADLTTPLIVAFGRAAARVLGAQTFLIGRDTRESGPRIEADLGRGLAAEGANVVALGVAPTPAIAFLAQRAGAPAAIVSASHNPWNDNGVKLIGADGRKLGDEAEAAIEAELLALIAQPGAQAASESRSTADAVTPVRDLDAYLEHLLAALDGRSLRGLRVVIDCANGAASDMGPRALRGAGAEVEVLHATPDGRNINDGCGSTDPSELQRLVVERGADLGLALDGDADRVVAVDEHGELVDGDQIMVMTALDWHERGMLRNDAIAVTVMSNLGLRRALATAGVAIVETPVGDRSVTAAMAERDLAIGGEQSGHIVFADLATTGDGVLTGLIVCDLVARHGAALSTLAAAMIRLPQVLVNVRLERKVDLAAELGVLDAVRTVEAELGDRGRVLVRSSGTEPVLRVMVEAPTPAEAEASAARIVTAIEQVEKEPPSGS
ncbi:MAG TPA: phosphoglucosamine mutase [Acidimicrobiia bacterium]|nr:phosphoglucosamine mutase [Acidimicrobiia bacterium]